LLRFFLFIHQIPNAIAARTAIPPITPPTIAPIGVDFSSLGIGIGVGYGPSLADVCGPRDTVAEDDDDEEGEKELRVGLMRVEELVLKMSSVKTRCVNRPPIVCPEYVVKIVCVVETLRTAQ
jgi:hypothetical protein